jgi:uncharacterized membrane protein YfcA
VLRFALLMSPFLIAGVAAGSWIQRFLDQTVFRKVVAAILTLTGILLLT